MVRAIGYAMGAVDDLSDDRRDVPSQLLPRVIQLQVARLTRERIAFVVNEVVKRGRQYTDREIGAMRARAPVGASCARPPQPR